jgi:hypothetical protein
MWSMNGSAVISLLDEASLPTEPAARHQALLMLATAVVMVGGRSALQRGLDLLGEVQVSAEPVVQVECAHVRMACLAFAGEHSRAAEAAEEAAALARRAGLRFHECAHLHNAAEQYCLVGDSDRSRACAKDSRAIAREIDAESLQHLNDMVLAYLDRDARDLSRIAEAMMVAGRPWLDFYAHYWLGRFLAEVRASGARGALERARQFAQDLAVRHLADDCDRLLASLDVS